MSSMKTVSRIYQDGIRPVAGSSLCFLLSPDFVSSYLRDLHLPTWIGLSDLVTENQYGWSDGVSPVLYTNWKDNEPNNAGGTVRIHRMMRRYVNQSQGAPTNLNHCDSSGRLSEGSTYSTVRKYVLQ